MYTPISREHADKNTARYWECSYWLPYSDEEEEGVWKHVDTGIEANYTNGWKGQPNGGRKENLIVGCPDWWSDTVVETTATAVCVNFRQPIFRLRGLCKKTVFPVLYSPFNYAISDSDWDHGMVYFSSPIASRKTIIKYDSSSGWVMAILSKSGNYTNATTLGMGLKYIADKFSHCSMEKAIH